MNGCAECIFLNIFWSKCHPLIWLGRITYGRHRGWKWWNNIRSMRSQAFLQDSHSQIICHRFFFFYSSFPSVCVRRCKVSALFFLCDFIFFFVVRSNNGRNHANSRSHVYSSSSSAAAAYCYCTNKTKNASHFTSLSWRVDFQTHQVGTKKNRRSEREKDGTERERERKKKTMWNGTILWSIN